MRQTLHVYIADDCWSCQETRRIVADVAGRFPEIQVEMRDMNQDKPDDVFAVPTYVLNGRVISLGNPTREELVQKLAAAQQLVHL
jgi:alkyl hydroperoxide reductase subunit AhpF